MIEGDAVFSAEEITLLREGLLRGRTYVAEWWNAHGGQVKSRDLKRIDQALALLNQEPYCQACLEASGLAGCKTFCEQHEGPAENDGFLEDPDA